MTNPSSEEQKAATIRENEVLKAPRRDKWGEKIPSDATFRIISMVPIEGDPTGYAVLAHSPCCGGMWIAGPVVNMPYPHMVITLYAEDAFAFRVEDFAHENHRERIAGDVR